MSTSTMTAPSLHADDTTKKKLDGHSVIYQYIGKDSSGRLRLRSATEELFVAGGLYAVSTPAKNKTVRAKQKVAMVPLYISPGFTLELNDNQTFFAQTNTGEQLRVVGRVISSRKPTQPITIKKRITLLSAPTPQFTQPVSTPTTKPAITQSKRANRKPTKEEQFKAELKRVMTLCEQGVDPEVQMAFVHQFIGKSASNIYKKIQFRKFPAPFRRGPNSLWMFSTLRAYQEGSWQPAETQL